MPRYPEQCSEPEPITWRDDAPDVSGRVCPVLLTQVHHEALRAWSMLERGLMPRAGGWAQQDGRWVLEMEAIEPAVARARAEHSERTRATHGD